MNKQEFFSFIPDFKELQESAVMNGGHEVAFQTSVILQNDYPLGSGFSRDAHQARQIALSEAIERRLVERYIAAPNSKENKDLLLDEYPTSCGFAVGGDRQSAKRRALAEAVERWIRSKWIDEGYALLETRLYAAELNPIEKYFASFFTDLRLFSHNCILTFENEMRTVNSVVVVGFTELGAFVGSKSTVNSKTSFLSALIESWRHLQILISGHLSLKMVFFAKTAPL